MTAYIDLGEARSKRERADYLALATLAARGDKDALAKQFDELAR